MAGDWIKVEHATADKPEILRAAEMLCISKRECLGLFFEFWIWLDKNLSGSCPDFVRNVSRKSLDGVLRCDGFSSVLEAIGWAEFDDDLWIIRVINADRHNGNTAKTRALDASRKRGQRADKTRTREEKSLYTYKGETLPTAQHRELAASLTLNADDQWQRYLDWMASSGKQHKDCNAGFRNWLKNAKGIGPAKPIRSVVAMNDWRNNEQAAQAKAREVGIAPNPGEDWPQFLQRLGRKIEERARA